MGSLIFLTKPWPRTRGGSTATPSFGDPYCFATPLFPPSPPPRQPRFAMQTSGWHGGWGPPSPVLIGVYTLYIH